MVDWKDGANVEKLRKLLDQGLTAREIALEFGPGCTRNSIIGKVHRLGLPFKDRVGNVVIKAPTRVKPVVVTKVTVKKAARRPERPPPELTVVARNPQPPTFLELPEHVVAPGDRQPTRLDRLSRRGCKYPVSRGTDGEWLMCNKEREAFEPSPYCAEHAKRCFNAPAPRKRSAK